MLPNISKILLLLFHELGIESKFVNLEFIFLNFVQQCRSKIRTPTSLHPIINSAKRNGAKITNFGKDPLQSHILFLLNKRKIYSSKISNNSLRRLRVLSLCHKL